MTEPGDGRAGGPARSPDPRRRIPAVDHLLRSGPFHGLLERHPRAQVVAGLRELLEEQRVRVREGADARLLSPDELAATLDARLASRATSSLRPVVNATGVILHTNLGRAPFSRDALRAVLRVGRGYGNVEYDLEEGRRGSRYRHCVPLLCELTGAESALVVNNAAAALLLAVNTAAAGREVVVSRGELVEIGGGFRIPEILTRGGVRLHEVGTTNRTRGSDYRRAIEGGDVGAILKVHRSNFRITGYVGEATVEELGLLAREAGIPLIHDVGSGLLLDPERLRLPEEPMPARSLAEGAHLALFSGDKLLGGPQAGVVVGVRTWVERLRANPLCRALRVDKASLAALEATLLPYRDPEAALREVPALQMITVSAGELEDRLRRILDLLRSRGVPVPVRLAEGHSVIGGGTYPGVEIPSPVLRIRPERGSVDELARTLRRGDPPVVVRLEGGELVVDVRTVLPREERALVGALLNALRAAPTPTPRDGDAGETGELVG